LISREELIDIAKKAKEYDPEGLARLFDIFFERLRRYFYYRTGDFQRAEDLAAETLTEAIENIQNFKDRGGTIGAWLFGIARNLLARWLEAEGKVEMVEIGPTISVADEEQPEQLTEKGITYEELYRALKKLPDAQREVLLLRVMEGFDAKTVGRLLGKRHGAVRALQFRAINSLKKILESGGVGK